MGTVFLAERADGEYHRQVAVKVIRPFLSSEGQRRFRTERQILASLKHPNIAHMLDADTTPDGHPYLVMELIEGCPIDEYCDRGKLPVGERLALFLDVCAAVHHAHLHHVVHRDLKPTNVLVTQSDSRSRPGRVKLLDFGIAKLLDAEAFPFTVEATATGMPAMTPQYASPEQICGQEVTAVSDVYSLGVLLYRLLTGLLPFRAHGAPPLQVIQLLLAGEPRRPSLALSERQDTAALFGTTPRALRRQLAGDLDSIVLKALQKEASRRYGSVEHFAEDVRRHLAGRPVTARGKQIGYRAGRMLSRWWALFVRPSGTKK